MKPSRMLCALVCALLLLSATLPAALADSGGYNNYYIIPDSDSRYLVEAELWDWQYEAVGYIYNEIFARHGRPFRTGEKYDAYFRTQAWYQVNPNYRYGLLNRVEQANEKLAHQVLIDMRAQKTTNPAGKPLPRSGDAYDTAFSFRSYNLIAGQKLEVYTGPGTHYYRSANGKAAVSTNGRVRIAGAEKGWLLIEYEVSGGNDRIGYINEGKLRDRRLGAAQLALAYEDGVVTAASCSLTDEPDGNQTVLATLRSGDSVLILGSYANGYGGRWIYVEASTSRGLMRGFVPTGTVAGVLGGDQYGVTDGYDWDDEGENG